jgi:hypothetical protein
MTPAAPGFDLSDRLLTPFPCVRRPSNRSEPGGAVQAGRTVEENHCEENH